MPNAQWFRRRWYDFRSGHSIYLSFVLAFANFIIITYALLIDRLPVVKDIFPHIWMWSILFILIYIPSALLIGYWHRRTQLRVETTITMLENPLFAKWLRILVELQQGVASKEEVDEMKRLLSQIEKKTNLF